MTHLEVTAAFLFPAEPVLIDEGIDLLTDQPFSDTTARILSVKDYTHWIWGRGY